MTHTHTHTLTQKQYYTRKRDFRELGRECFVLMYREFITYCVFSQLTATHPLHVGEQLI